MPTVDRGHLVQPELRGFERGRLAAPRVRHRVQGHADAEAHRRRHGLHLHEVSRESSI